MCVCEGGFNTVAQKTKEATVPKKHYIPKPTNKKQAAVTTFTRRVPTCITLHTAVCAAQSLLEGLHDVPVFLDRGELPVEEAAIFSDGCNLL